MVDRKGCYAEDQGSLLLSLRKEYRKKLGDCEIDGGRIVKCCIKFYSFLLFSQVVILVCCAK